MQHGRSSLYAVRTPTVPDMREELYCVHGKRESSSKIPELDLAHSSTAPQPIEPHGTDLRERGK